ncbi:MAG: amidohydrolase family protein [bacterium]
MQNYYKTVDLPFYKNEVLPILPAQVLDFHAHLWTKQQWKKVPWEENAPGSKYMVTQTDYSVEKLLADGRMIFPDCKYNAVCFGNPTPAVDLELTNDYVAMAGRKENFFPLMIAGRDIMSQEKIKQRILKDGFMGYKVFLNWFGNDYGNVSIEDMIGSAEMELANKYHLIVLLHVPRDERLADPEVQSGLRNLSENYPNSQIVLAHCGRCYLPDQMKKAINAVKNLENVYLDTSMVMDPLVLQMVFETIDSKRVLFATDLPVANMRGRRVYVMNHWVDIVLEGYPLSAYRVEAKDIHATFMVYEIILAIRRAAERAQLSQEQLQAIFYDNGMALLKSVRV